MANKYLHSFTDQSSFNTAYLGSDYKEPWTSYVYSNESVKFNKSEKDILRETPLTFKILTSGDIKFYTYDANTTRTIQYRKNNGDWTSLTSGPQDSEAIISVELGDTVEMKGTNACYSWGALAYAGFKGCTCKFDLYGNIMSLINGETFPTLTEIPHGYQQYGFQYLFKYPATDGGPVEVSKLQLPATTLGTRCYAEFFRGCPLVSVPELPAMTLADKCYAVMFADCKSLLVVPKGLLPATTLASSCYEGMFCYSNNLSVAPDLPATTLAQNCYGGYGSYSGMFRACNIEYPPELPATTATAYCYSQMFAGSKIKVAPKLPATTLASSCYANMFSGCPNLTTAPDLPALTLVDGCYGQMFRGTPISRIKCLATSIPSTGCTGLWLYQTTYGSTSVFIKHPNMNGWTRDNNGIPDSWTVEDAVL